MKIIDEKGKLFGKINLIDFLVILLMLCLVPAFFFGYKIFTKRSVIETEEERIIDLDVTLKDLDEDVLKKISVGDKEVDESGKTIAEILSLGKVENSSQAFDFGGNNVAIEKDRTKKQITTKMRLKCQVKDSRELYFKGVKVGENTSVKFKTNNYEVIGQVVLKEKWVSLRVKFSGVPPEIAGLIQKGDTEKDPFDKITARMSSIISNEPSQNWVVTITDKGEFITRNRPFHRDIMVSLDVLCVEKKGAYYFKESRVKMGNKIIFETDSYSISGDILGMKMR